MNISMKAKKVKEAIKDLGADICGIASVDRFNNAPKGFHPTDIFKDCKSVIVFAKRVPSGSLYASSCVPYTVVSDNVTREVDDLGIKISDWFEENGITAVPIPSDDPYEYWESHRLYGRAILSMRHAGYLAGLGVLGKNTLLVNEKFGNMIQIGAILIDTFLEEDPIANYEACPPGCNLCIESCPQDALDGKTVNQQLCRSLSIFKTKKGYVLKKCNLCRKICSNCLGIK